MQHGDDASKQYHCADVTTIQLKVEEHLSDVEDDGSSIEALPWSDFDDEELEQARINVPAKEMGEEQESQQSEELVKEEVKDNEEDLGESSDIEQLCDLEMEESTSTANENVIKSVVGDDKDQTISEDDPVTSCEGSSLNEDLLEDEPLVSDKLWFL